MCCNCCCCCCCCCCPPPVKTSERLQFPAPYRWLERCPLDANCSEAECVCLCRRNRHIVEALSCLFDTSVQHMVSTLFRLLLQRSEPMKRFPRDRRWEVMEHVKAPYTELNDLEIYDSMFDRCGLPIDPLHADNIFKIVRLMFMVKVLTLDQQKYLLRMLERLNRRARIAVDLELLLRTLEDVDVRELMCSLRRQERLIRSLYNARQCSRLCDLYHQVVTVDKNAVQQQRQRRRRRQRQLRFGASGKRLKATTVETGDEASHSPVRQSQLQRQYCDRKSDVISSAGSPTSGLTPSVRHRHTGSTNLSRSSK